MWVKYKNKYGTKVFLFSKQLCSASVPCKISFKNSDTSFLFDLEYQSHVQVCPDVADTSELQKSVKQSEVKLAFCVFNHVPQRHKTREGLDHSGKNKWRWNNSLYIHCLNCNATSKMFTFWGKCNHTCESTNIARTMWTPLSRGCMRMASLKSWNRMRGDCSRRLSSQNPANSGTFRKHKHDISYTPRICNCRVSLRLLDASPFPAGSRHNPDKV